MKLKLRLIFLFPLILIIRCTADDSIWNDEKDNQKLENTNSNQSKVKLLESIPVKTIYYDYPVYVYYSNSEVLNSYNMIKILQSRNNFILTKVNGSNTYYVPDEVNLLYDTRRKQHYEIWGTRSPCAGKTSKHEIEL